MSGLIMFGVLKASEWNWCGVFDAKASWSEKYCWSDTGVVLGGFQGWMIDGTTHFSIPVLSSLRRTMKASRKLPYLIRSFVGNEY